MKYFLLIISFLMIGCGFGGFTVKTGDLATAYRNQADLNPEKICTPYMLEKVWDLINKGSYYGFTKDDLHRWSGDELSKLAGSNLSWMTLYPQKIFDIWAKIDMVARDKKLTRSEVCYTVIKGIIKNLKKYDKWANFSDAVEGEKRFSGMIGSDYYGLGFLMKADYKNSRLFVSHVYKDSPAEKGGMKDFDEIFSIDKKVIGKLDIKKVMIQFRGKRGSKVKVLIKRKSWKAPRTLTFIRDLVPYKDARCYMIGEIAYCKVFGFTKNTVKYFEDELSELPNYNKLIVDFRDNPGGLIFSATNMLNRMWVKDMTLAILVKREYGFVPFGDNTHKEQLLKNKKVVVLINKGSASATELVVAALKDYKSATLMGETTFGKGVSQTNHFILGAVLAYTSMHFISPHGNIINEIGVSPDIKVGMTLEDFIDNNDTQLNAAIKLLKKESL